MTRIKGSDKVKSWGQAIAKRSCHRKACVAVARKLAVIMHAMWSMPVDAELGYLRPLSDHVQCRRLKTQFRKEFARRVDYLQASVGHGLFARDFAQCHLTPVGLYEKFCIN